LTLLNNEYKNMERRKITKGKMVKGFKAKLLGMAAKLGVTGKNKTIIENIGSAGLEEDSDEVPKAIESENIKDLMANKLQR